MNPVCREYREKIALALHGELDAAEGKALQGHLARCPSCTEDHASWEESMAVMRAGRPDPYSPKIWDRLAPRLDEVDRERAAGRGKESRVLEFSSRPSWISWARPLAAAAAIAVVTVLVVRAVVPPAPLPTESPVAAVSEPDPEISRFLRRSERILLGISNLDPLVAEQATFDFSAERSLAEDLILESADLKSRLSPSRDRALYAIVSDLEKIFLVVSNIRGPETGRDLKLVQSVLEEEGIFFDMSLEEIRRRSGATIVKRSA